MRFFTPIIVVLLLASVIANGVMYAKYRSRRPILTVNGESITKKDMYDYLEQNYSPQYKAMQTKRMLISQAAKKKKRSATQAEIDEQYNNQKELNWQFVQRIHNSPWIADEAKNEVKYTIEASRLLLDKVNEKVQITQEEILDEYTRNHAQYDLPNKAHGQLAILLKEQHSSEIFKLMQQNPPVKPTVIMQNYPNEVVFLGDNYQFTFVQPFGTQGNQIIFNMKPGEVKRVPLDANLARQATGMIVRMDKTEPGHANDPMKDPKTKEKVMFAIAARRGNFSIMLQDLWDNASIVSEDPNDKRYIELTLFPDKFR